jgi:hypothetical protein
MGCAFLYHRTGVAGVPPVGHNLGTGQQKALPLTALSTPERAKCHG